MKMLLYRQNPGADPAAEHRAEQFVGSKEARYRAGGQPPAKNPVLLDLPCNCM